MEKVKSSEEEEEVVEEEDEEEIDGLAGLSGRL